MGREVTRDPKIARKPHTGSKLEGAETRVSGTPSAVRIVSDEQFKKVHRKTSTLHAGLFRRLAK
jgi:hypothetical protein